MKPYYNVTAAIIIENGKVFAPKRGASRYSYTAHKYEFPGGKIEQGETPEQALIREMREEMAVNITIERHFLTLEHEYADFSITLHTFLCRLNGDYRLLEHESCNWLKGSQLNPEEWAGADAAVLEKLKALLAD